MIFKHRRGPVDFLIVGLGNPGSRYAGTRHNIGFEVAAELHGRWRLSCPKRKYGGLLSEGRVPVAGLRLALLLPQTYMNEAGASVGPAAGSYKLPPQRVIVIHDEIDLPFGEVRTRLGGGLAGHNGLKSVKAGLGSADFQRLRVGVGRPASSDPEVVSAYVLSKFREPKSEVAELVVAAAGEAERLIENLCQQPTS